MNGHYNNNEDGADDRERESELNQAGVHIAEWFRIETHSKHQ